MSRAFREARQQAKQRSAEHRHRRDDYGRVIVDMTVNDDTNFLSVFSASNNPVISAEVAEFIEASTRSILPKDQITMRIHSSCIDDDEKEIYRSAIREYYLEQYSASRRTMQRSSISIVVLGVIGVLILALGVLLERSAVGIVLARVVEIAAWVLIWEAVHQCAFRRQELRVHKLRCLSFLSMNIEFTSR